MDSYYRYWGKAKIEDEGGSAFHLLPYHCLDVAAVACAWWQQSKVIRELFVVEAGLSEKRGFDVQFSTKILFRHKGILLGGSVAWRK